LVTLFDALIPQRVAMTFVALGLLVAAAACFGAGGWLLYQSIVEETERALAAVSLLACAMGWALALVGWKLWNERPPRGPRTRRGESRLRRF
jgi:hypothetical protein